MEFRDQIDAPVGRLILDIFEDGKHIEHFDQNNLIVSGTRNVLASLLGGGAGPVTQIGFGTNGTAPSAGNTSLTSAYLKGFDSVEYPSSGLVKFNFTLGSTEANGKAISEFGLLTAAGILVARRVRSSPINKNAAISFTGAWLIQF